MTAEILALARTLPFHSIGGMQAVAWDLLRQFARDGHEVTVLTTAINGRTDSFLHDGVSVVPIMGTTPERCDAAWWEGSRVFAADRYAQRAPTAVLSISAAGAGLLPLRDTWRGAPFVFQAHGTSWGEVISKWRSGRPLQWAKSIRNLYWLFKDVAIYRRFDCIAAVGDVIAKQLQAWPHSSLTPDLPVEVIRNGVDQLQFKPDDVARNATRQELGWSGDARVTVFAGRLHPQKGALQAIHAFNLSAASDSLARMLIVGAGEEEAGLRALVASSGSAGRIHFTGAVPRERMPALLVAGDAFIFPSLRQEGLPMNVLEALACGLRPVCSSAMRTVFDRSLPIRFAQPHDAAALSRELSQALNEGPSVRSLLSPGYTLEECASAYIRLFERLRLA